MSTDKIEIKDQDGNVLFYCEYMEEEGWVYNFWSGSITDDLVRKGGLTSLDLVEKHNASYILNDNRQLSGNWSGSNDWIENEYMPRAIKVGLKYIAHVFSPKFITKFSAVDLSTRDLPVIFRNFGDIEEAKEWLRERISSKDSK